MTTWGNHEEGEEHIVWNDTRVCVWFYTIAGGAPSVSGITTMAWRYEVLFKEDNDVREFTATKSAQAIRLILAILRQAINGTLSPTDFTYNRYKHV